ncbi:DUF3846 domain-containing protein [Streptomyces broussonetiae]|uniref:DUF3846 domain-containing protein n=1 Tax=Streptomyces broussonetiae TaxID=2686304 RepID=A0ABV5EJ35_9ACTN
MITAIVLPADLRTPIRTVELDKRDLNAYRGLVGGPLEIITFERPEATLYLNDEGKLEGLPLNQRATLMASVHNSAFRGRDVIVGDAFLVGPADRHGDDLSVPKELVTLLLRTERFRVLMQSEGDPEFYGNLLVYNHWLNAYAGAVEWAQRLPQVEEVRVVAAE